ncbi:MAG: sugar ABC transporter permease [Chloroflexi bacterium]|nr:MAG: sugar ABC transporter permease [Chloroflexota bacterium]
MRRRFRLKEEQVAGLLFVSPFIVGFLIFSAGPYIASLYLSLTTYDVLNPPNFVGLQNYIDLASDETFGKALYNTLYFVVFHGPTAIAMALILALLLNAKVRGVSIWRTIYYLPQVTPAVALGVLWLRILSPNNGLLNSILAGVGIQGPAWTVDADWVKPSLILIRVFVVGTWMITFLAALQDVPQELYEAASIDGANAWQRFRNVTLPMISRVIFFAVIAITIFSMNVFDIAYFMFPPQVFGGQLGPQDSALFYMVYLFQQAFSYFHMGYAAALAWILFAITLAITLIQLRLSRYFVYAETSK